MRCRIKSEFLTFKVHAVRVGNSGIILSEVFASRIDDNITTLGMVQCSEEHWVAVFSMAIFYKSLFFSVLSILASTKTATLI